MPFLERWRTGSAIKGSQVARRALLAWQLFLAVIILASCQEFVLYLPALRVVPHAKHHLQLHHAISEHPVKGIAYSRNEVWRIIVSRTSLWGKRGGY